MRIGAIILIFAFCIMNFMGCVVRTYKVTKDRIDQDLSAGNRGYLKGQTPSGETKERKRTRTSQVVEIELHSPIKFERVPKGKPVVTRSVMEKTEDQDIWGNRGLVSQSEIPEMAEEALNVEKYTVGKGDTLQKISRKFYGTTKKWNKIYEANKNVLKGADKIYPGQVIDIPIETVREAPQKLKIK